MKKINKANTIIDAFTEPLPIGEEWYEKRLAICAPCEYNSANAASKNLITKVLQVADVPQCTACGCIISRKAGRKEEECGLAEIGKTPKWPRLLVHTVSEEDFNLYNNSPEKINVDLSVGGTMYVVDYGKVTPVTNTQAQLLMEGKFPINRVWASCSCTTPTFKRLSEELWEINIGINLERITIGKFSKKVFVRYKTKTGERTVEISLTGIKAQK